MRIPIIVISGAGGNWHFILFILLFTINLQGPTENCLGKWAPWINNYNNNDNNYNDDDDDVGNG